MISKQENIDNRTNVKNNWKLGPEKTSQNPADNKDYWDSMSKIWGVPVIEARAMLCANCEYYDNTKDMQIEMLSIPLDSFDTDGGGRGFCEKFDFICHNLRTCQAWEDKSIIDGMKEEVFKSFIVDTIKNSK
jgi:hypothetical protein